MTTPKAGDFRGVVSGVTYTNRREFERAARACGWRLGLGRTGDWRVGIPLRVRLDEGSVIDGQVWAKGPFRDCGYVWAALDDGQYARIYTRDIASTRTHSAKRAGRVELVSALGHPVLGIGRVAA